MEKPNTQLAIPSIIAGPLLRHVDASCVTIWLVTSTEAPLSASLFDEQSQALALNENKTEHHSYRVGKRCFIHLLRLVPAQALSVDAPYHYQINLGEASQRAEKNTGQDLIPFYFAKHLSAVAHGSCRKAHFKGDDALARVKDLLDEAQNPKNAQRGPDLLLMTGDQVYIDDVAGPMVYAIHQVIELLGLYHEDFEQSVLESSKDLTSHEYSYYQREHLFPEIEQNEALKSVFFKAKKKPVFTSVHAHNHLIALSEMLALYLLSWSSRLWPLIDIKTPPAQRNFSAELNQQYDQEYEAIEGFVSSLEGVEYALTRIPTYMIFDDHDVTDDWNLTRGWEEQVYGNAFSRQIVGNALCAYFLCQGIGNPFDKIATLNEEAKSVFSKDGDFEHQAFIETLFEFDQWHYQLDTSPPIQVLDTRTQRWRSESNKNKPSGLMDWEGLCELQQNIIGHDSVIMVSAAPVYGLKFIETVQRIFTAFGGALIVDAENWMAHRGTASVMLNIFRHVKTPPNFIILSGDVHYSFVYDVALRFKRNSPKIVQFTCSGFHNEFPEKLLSWFERLNRWFYGHRSPLNIFTKRRNMSVRQRKADDPKLIKRLGKGKSQRDVVNACSVGLLRIDSQGHESACEVICGDGTRVSFSSDKDGD